MQRHPKTSIIIALGKRSPCLLSLVWKTIIHTRPAPRIHKWVCARVIWCVGLPSWCLHNIHAALHASIAGRVFLGGNVFCMRARDGPAKEVYCIIYIHTNMYPAVRTSKLHMASVEPWPHVAPYSSRICGACSYSNNLDSWNTMRTQVTSTRGQQQQQQLLQRTQSASWWLFYMHIIYNNYDASRLSLYYRTNSKLHICSKRSPQECDGGGRRFARALCTNPCRAGKCNRHLAYCVCMYVCMRNWRAHQHNRHDTQHLKPTNNNRS